MGIMRAGLLRRMPLEAEHRLLEDHSHPEHDRPKNVARNFGINMSGLAFAGHSLVLLLVLLECLGWCPFQHGRLRSPALGLLITGKAQRRASGSFECGRLRCGFRKSNLMRTARALARALRHLREPFSGLVLPLEGICPFQEISGKGLEAESSLRIIDCPCQLKGTASVRA